MSASHLARLLRSAALPLVLLAGCGGVRAWREQAALSPTPQPRRGALQAGFGRVDITPPTGVGLTGNGPEGNRAAGYRMRLYARALVLEQATGDRVALVVADLPHISLLLQRRVELLSDPAFASPFSWNLGRERAKEALRALP